MTKKKPYVQFSKKVVVAVTVAVTVLCFLSIALMYGIGQVQYMADVIKMYIAYAMIVFASYSGNSVAQKIIAHNQMNKILTQVSTDDDTDDDTEDDESQDEG